MEKKKNRTNALSLDRSQSPDTLLGNAIVATGPNGSNVRLGVGRVCRSFHPKTLRGSLATGIGAVGGIRIRGPRGGLRGGGGGHGGVGGCKIRDVINGHVWEKKKKLTTDGLESDLGVVGL